MLRSVFLAFGVKHMIGLKRVGMLETMLAGAMRVS